MLPLEAIHTLAIERCAGVAQSVEQLIRNEKVGCSIHLSGTNEINNLASLHKSGAFLFVLHVASCTGFRHHNFHQQAHSQSVYGVSRYGLRAAKVDSL